MVAAIGSNEFQLVDMTDVLLINKNTDEKSDILGVGQFFGTLKIDGNNEGLNELNVETSMLHKDLAKEIELNGIKNYRVECRGLVYNYELEEFTHDVSIVSEFPTIEIEESDNEWKDAKVVLGVSKDNDFSPVKMIMVTRL